MRDILACLMGLILLLQSCVLEERIHFNEDLSGVCKLSFSMGSSDEDNEGNEMTEDGIENINSVFSEIKEIHGVDDANINFLASGFDIEMKFQNLHALNEINEVGKTSKAQGRFLNQDGRLYFSLGEFLKYDGTSYEQDEEWKRSFKHRIKITFDKKIKGLESNGFEKTDKKTLEYDSEKMDVTEISFSIKHKK